MKPDEKLLLNDGPTAQTRWTTLAERLATVKGIPQLPTQFLEIVDDRDGSHIQVETDPEVQRTDEESWLEHRRGRIAKLGSLRVTSATGLAREADIPAPETAADLAVQRRGRGGTSLGRAVHAVLQVIDLETLDSLAGHAAAQAAAEGIPDRAVDVERLVRAAAATEAVQRAARSRHWRELPLGAEVDGVIVEGFIDLLYEEADGRLVVLDYKTDAVSGAEVDRRLEHYRLQGGVYALLAGHVARRDVSRVNSSSLRQVRRASSRT